MEYQVSARKYRPGTFQDVIGQPHVVRTLVNAIAAKRIAHAFLFSGTRGVGKTTVARILAKALNCERGGGTPCDLCPTCLEIGHGTSVDVIEIDGASNTGVDDVREIRENVKFTPFRGHYRVYIIDEVHMLSNSAFNALLKTLEEPPSHVVFIFATTEIHKIPATILSRCQHFNFRRISTSEITRRLRHVADRDGIEVEDRSLALIARAAEGSMRDGLSLLDQAVAFGGKTIRHGDLESLLGSVPQEHIRSLLSAVMAQDSPQALRVIAQLLDCGHDLRAYCGGLVEYVRNLLVASVVQTSDDAQGRQTLHGLIDLAEEEVRQVIADAKALTVDQLQELLRIFSQAEDAVRLSPHPRFVLEAAAIRATRILQDQAAITNASRGHVKPTIKTSPESSSPATPDTTCNAAPVVEATASMTIQAADDRSPAQPSKPPARAASRSDMPPLAPPPKAQSASPDHANMSAIWEQVVEQLERTHPNIGPILAMGVFLGLEGNHIMVGYPKTASIALTRIQKEETLTVVTKLCAELAGRPVRLRAVELMDGQAAPPSLAQVRAAKKQSQTHSLLEQTRSHPLVKQTLAIFGGEVVEVRQTSSQEETR
ncbi:MAG: DNA polymerase III subunit gamma/tau [Nitrospiraceae bacterium]|nr:DNA polymerase III subunit gamma/tau [Nitrospiraceae bacterium]